MTAIHGPGSAGTGRRWRVRLALAFSTAGLLAAGCQALAQEPVAAVFKAREVDFVYRSSTNEYACDELRNRVANILVAVGARDDIDVRITDCDLSLIPGRSRVQDSRNPWNPANPSSRFDTRSGADQAAHVRVRLMMPVEATPEVLAELDKDRSRRELLSRVTGNPTAMFNEPTVFAAQRQEVTLSRRTIRLEPEDCELLDEMTSSVFRKLNVRVVRRNFTCDPRQFSRIAPQLTVEALLPTGAPPPGHPSGAGPSAPAASASEPSEPADETPPR